MMGLDFGPRSVHLTALRAPHTESHPLRLGFKGLSLWSEKEVPCTQWSSRRWVGGSGTPAQERTPPKSFLSGAQETLGSVGARREGVRAWVGGEGRGAEQGAQARQQLGSSAPRSGSWPPGLCCVC